MTLLQRFRRWLQPDEEVQRYLDGFGAFLGALGALLVVLLGVGLLVFAVMFWIAVL